MIDIKTGENLETPEKVPLIPTDHLKSNDELEKIRKELHSINVTLNALVKVIGRSKRS